MAFDPIAYINEPRWQESRLGLDRIQELLERLGRPQDKCKFVHVAGTNGKGSTCAYLTSILQAAGYRTGLFTSPYIMEFAERIRVDGCNIDADQLSQVTLAVKHHADAMEAETGEHPTEFELMTAVALEHFARQHCDIAVLEVGLGGRLDSTNAIAAPEVAVIARIGLDHTELLGATLAAVAGEKAGIIKSGCSVVSWPQDDEAMAVVRRVAAQAGCVLTVPDFSQLRSGPCHPANPAAEGAARSANPVANDAARSANDAENGAARSANAAAGDGASPANPVANDAARSANDAEKYPQNVSRETFVRDFSYGEYHNLETRLLGSYQPQNAALAIEAAVALQKRGWEISSQAVREGIARTSWPGRFEVLSLPASASDDAPPTNDSSNKPATLRGNTLVVDGGHNPQGARALVDSLNDVFPGQHFVFIVGVLKDKDYVAMLHQVLPLASAFVTVAPPNPRALPAEDLAQVISSMTSEHVQAAHNMKDALTRAQQLAGHKGIIVAFGSLYSVASIKAELAN